MDAHAWSREKQKEALDPNAPTNPYRDNIKPMDAFELVRQYKQERVEANRAFHADVSKGYSFSEGKWKARLQCYICEKYKLSDARGLAIIERVDEDYDIDSHGSGRFEYLTHGAEDLVLWLQKFDKLG